MLGGIGVGLFTALNPLLLSDLMRGTGRYNLAQGAIATILSLGVSSSGLVTELVVGRFGYDAAFCTSAVAARRRWRCCGSSCRRRSRIWKRSRTRCLVPAFGGAG